MQFRALDAAVANMAEALAQPAEPHEALQRIAEVAQATIPPADYVSITVRRGDQTLGSLASTDPLTEEMDSLQYQLREGPCYDAVTSETITYASDLAAGERWPRYGPQAAALGIRSQMAVRMNSERTATTGLNLYAVQPGAFDETNGLPELFASHARVALGYASQLDNLQGAIGTRETIGKAIGILMERYGLTAERSFEFLVRTSQDGNTKLRDIAAQIVEMREDQTRQDRTEQS